MYGKTAVFYDAIYSWKNYKAEAARLREIIEQYSRRPVETVLDVACGTGVHISYLREFYNMEGVDMDPNMLAVARERNPDITFTEADMANFDLGRTFDAVLCLFSAIGHVHTLERLHSTLRAFARHVNPGGVVIVEPWITPDKFKEGGVHALFVDEPDVKLARMNLSDRKGQMAVFDMHHLVGTPERIEYFVEHLELFMFTHEENLEAFRIVGLSVAYDPQGLMGRGLYIGVKDGQ